MSNENIVQALNEIRHEVLSHELFLGCFSGAVKRREIKGLRRSSLFRMTLAYFLLVPHAKRKVPERIREAIDDDLHGPKSC